MSRDELTLPVLKILDSPEQMTREERMDFQGNDPVAATEFEEMATLFLQMHDLICGASINRLRGLLEVTDSRLSHTGLHVLQARAQSLIDNTGSFTRPLRTS